MSSFQRTETSWRPGPGRASGPRARFGQRLAAKIIDIVIWTILSTIISSALKAPQDPTLLAVVIAYCTFLEGGARGQSIGKTLVRIRVVSIEDENPIGYQRALIRTLGQILSAIPLCLGFLWMLWDPERQTWHDKLSGAVVIPATPSTWQPTF
jgi:uncharacterized RDD family membrane protein YckC